jgi:hypothetical protein
MKIPSQYRFLAALAVAATGSLAAPTPSHASLIFDFSFTESGVGSVTGEIDGLTNGSSVPATHVIVDTVTGISAPFPIPFDTITDVFDNRFTVANNLIIGSIYDAIGPNHDWGFDISGLSPAAVLENNITNQSIRAGVVTFTAVSSIPEPSINAVLGALVGLFLLRFARAKRRDRQIRPDQATA